MRAALRGLLAALALCAGPACAQVEWFTSERPGETGYRFSSYIGTIGGTPTGTVTRPCTFTGANVPVPKPAWWLQFGPCRPTGLTRSGASLAFRAEDRDEPRIARASVKTRATHEVDFTPDSLRVHAEVEVKPVGDTSGALRVLPNAFADIHFRIPDGADQRVAFKGRLAWSGAATAWNGSFGITWMPNTVKGTNHLHFGIHPSQAKPGATEMTFGQTGVLLSPGVYRISWNVHDDRWLNASRVSLDVEMSFASAEEICPDPPRSRPVRWSPDKGFSAVVEVEPMSSDAASSVDDMRIDSKGTRVRWKRRPVNFTLSKDGKTTRHVGWALEPGSVRRDLRFEHSCRQLDFSFNCHGLSLAAGAVWVEKEAANEILFQWCEQVTPQQRRALPKDTALIRTLDQQDKNVWPIAVLLLRGLLDTQHSQVLRAGLPGVDEKLGVLRYDFGNFAWTSGGNEIYWRCSF